MFKQLNYTNVVKKYYQGYRTGLKWEENYRPGGPFVPKPSATDEEKHKATQAQAKAESEAWFEGFDMGLEKRKEKHG